MDKNTILRGLRMSLAPVLADNQMREAEALRGYYELRDRLNNWCREQGRKAEGQYDQAVISFWQKYCKPLFDEIEEIIGDELNHSAKLTKRMIEFGLAKPAED